MLPFDKCASLIGVSVTKKPWWCIGALLCIAIVFIVQLPALTLDVSTEGFLRDDDVVLIEYKQFKETFGNDLVGVISITTDDVFSETFLEQLFYFHHELERQVPFVTKVTSLVNARYTFVRDNTLHVEALFPQWPVSDQRLNEIKSYALESSTVNGLLLSADAKIANIILYASADIQPESFDDLVNGFEDNISDEFEDDNYSTSLTPKQNHQFVAAVEEIAEQFKQDNFDIISVGAPFVADVLMSTLQNDMQLFMVLSFFIILLLLAILFKRLAGVVIPFVAVSLAVASTLGAMAVSGIPIKVPTQILPTFLLAIGVASSVHFLVIFFKEYALVNDRVIATKNAYQHTFVPVTMTAITTAAGLSSFASSAVAPVGDLGVFGVVGVFFCWLYTLFLIPAILVISPLKKARKNVDGKSLIHKWLIAIAQFSVKRYKLILLVSFCIIVISVFYTSTLKFHHDPFDWLPEEYDIRKNTAAFDEIFRNTSTLEVIVDTQSPGGIAKKEIVDAIEKFIDLVNEVDSLADKVGKITSINDIIKETHRSLNDNNADFFRLPQTSDAVAQELLLFESASSDEIRIFTDPSFSMARITIRIAHIDAFVIRQIISELEKIGHSLFSPNTNFYITGMGALLSQTMETALISMKQSYLVAFIIVTIFMVFALGSWQLGLVSMLPNVLPILAILGLMGWLDIPLDLSTMLIGSIAIGLVVDDTIHYMHAIKQEMLIGGNWLAINQRAMLGTGRAIFITTCVLSCGFFIFIAGQLENVINFGLLTGMTVVLAMFADFLVVPALLVGLKLKGLAR